VDGLEENSIELMSQSRDRAMFCQRCYICGDREWVSTLGTPKGTRLPAQENPVE